MASDWRRVAAIFDRAAELPPEERGALLDDACGDDAELRAEVESLLAADDGSHDFLAQPALEEGAAGRRRPGAAAPKRRAIGPYRLLRRIGSGGMSTVYLAVRADDAYRQEVAVKVFALGHEREDLLRRFRTERQILASLEHPQIARLLDGGSTGDGLPYIVMEHIVGEPIDRYCDRERLSIDRRIELFRSLCEAVHYAHQNLVVHRDVKPSNVLVTADGTPKLLDFGIAKLVNPERFPQTIQHTATGQRLMTPQFASPEQVQGAPITTASDVYSMGVLLYRLLTGHLPYQVATTQTAEIERAVLEQDPQKPSTAVSRIETAEQADQPEATPEAVSRARRTRPDRLRRRLTGDLDNIVLKALRKEPRRRYGSIEQLAEDLRRYQEGLPVAARPATLRYRAGKFLRRHRFGTAAIATIVLLALGLAVSMWLQAARIAHERDQARRERDKAQAVAAFLEEIFKVSDPGETRGETITAREILERGAERIRAELEDQPEIEAALAAAVGAVYRNLGMYDRAEPLLERALEVRRRTLGDQHPETADSLSVLGRLLRDRGDFEAAGPLLERALELRRRILGEDHPAVAESLTDLGVLGRERGDLEAAEDWLLRALELRRTLRGRQPEQLADTLAELVELYIQIDDLPAAEALAREALELSRQLHGEVHPRTARDMNDLAVLLGIQGKYAAAEPLLEQTLEIRRRLLGDAHPLVAESYNNLGRLRREQGDLAAAQELYERALESQRVTFPGGHWRLVAQLHNLGSVQIERGDFAGAEASFREALEIGGRILDGEDPHVGRAHLGLGTLRLAQGDPAAAEPHLRRNLEILSGAFSADHRRVADAESLLGQCLGTLGRFDEAEPLVLAGYRKLADNLGPTHRRSQEALDRVIALYQAWGRGDDAAAYRQKKSSPR